MERNDYFTILFHAKRILDCEDLFALSDRLRGFLTWLRGQKEKNKKIIELYRILRANSFDLELPKGKYKILHGREAVCEYLFGAWMPCKYYKDNLTLLENTIAYIEKHFVAPEGQIITTDKIENLMSSVDKHFHFSDKVLKKSLPILLLNHSHIDNNGFLAQNLYVDNEFQINMLYIRNSNVTVEQVFLHELGHILHAQLTGSQTMIPDDMQEVLNLLCPAGSSDPEGKENFADFFMVALTGFEPAVTINGFDFVTNNTRELYAKYTKKLIEFID